MVTCDEWATRVPEGTSENRRTMCTFTKCLNSSVGVFTVNKRHKLQLCIMLNVMFVKQLTNVSTVSWQTVPPPHVTPLPSCHTTPIQKQDVCNLQWKITFKWKQTHQMLKQSQRSFKIKLQQHNLKVGTRVCNQPVAVVTALLHQDLRRWTVDVHI